jgi:hypothetical protein
MARKNKTNRGSKPVSEGPHWTEGGGLLTALVSNGLILAIGAWAWIHSNVDPPQYKALLQEDGPLEWATVIAFLAATGLAGFLASKQWRQYARLPW